MVALSRPRHFVLFAFALTALFGLTFQVTQAVHEAPPVEPEPMPVVREGLLEAVLFTSPEPLPDLVVAELSARECLSGDPERSGGIVTLVVRNDGQGVARGFALFAGLDVRNVRTGDALQEEGDVWVEEMAPGATVTIRVPYSFPQHDTVVLGTAAVGQPVPGTYRIEAKLDRPSALTSLGDAGVLPESDEHNNFAETTSDGMAEGLC